MISYSLSELLEVTLELEPSRLHSLNLCLYSSYNLIIGTCLILQELNLIFKCSIDILNSIAIVIRWCLRSWSCNRNRLNRLRRRRQNWLCCILYIPKRIRNILYLLSVREWLSWRCHQIIISPLSYWWNRSGCFITRILIIALLEVKIFVLVERVISAR